MTDWKVGDIYDVELPYGRAPQRCVIVCIGPNGELTAAYIDGVRFPIVRRKS